MGKPLLVLIGGPTAVGKTALAVELAKVLHTVILSTDSRQFYRGMDIGTAKPTLEERSQVTHYGIDIREPDEDYSVGSFAADTQRLLSQLWEQYPVAIATGGSGLYLQALYKPLDAFPEVDPGVRRQLQVDWQEKGLEYLQELLSSLDPASWEKIDRKNPRRLLRALEVCLSSGKPYSSYLNQDQALLPYRVLKVCLVLEREELYRRIEARVDEMLQSGLEAEVRRLRPYESCNALQTVGYKEWFPYFRGDCELREVVSRIKQHSRNYAKRQLTWFRNQGDWLFFHPDEKEKILDLIRGQLS